jgi:hypothetical protein
MYVVVRRYIGAAELFDAMEHRKEEVELLLRGVPGFITYYALRSGSEGASVTVCDDRAGTRESTRLAADWVRQNVPGLVASPMEAGLLTNRQCNRVLHGFGHDVLAAGQSNGPQQGYGWRANYVPVPGCNLVSTPAPPTGRTLGRWSVPSVSQAALSNTPYAGSTFLLGGSVKYGRGRGCDGGFGPVLRCW